MSEPTYAVENGWLVELVNQHTCGTDRDGHYGAHEPGCGMVPIAKVDDLLAAAQRPEGVALAEAHGCEVEDEDTGRILTVADRDARKPWEWKRPPGHEDQPLAEWWVEQVAVVIVLAIGKRAHRRGDQQTLNRMLALAFAGRDAEVITPPGASTSTRDAGGDR